MVTNRLSRKTQIIGWTAGVALFVNALGWVLDDIEVVRSLGNLQALLELAGDLSYGAFGLAIWWAIYNSWLRRPPTQEDPVLGQSERPIPFSVPGHAFRPGTRRD